MTDLVYLLLHADCDLFNLDKQVFVCMLSFRLRVQNHQRDAPHDACCLEFSVLPVQCSHFSTQHLDNSVKVKPLSSPEQFLVLNTFVFLAPACFNLIRYLAWQGYFIHAASVNVSPVWQDPPTPMDVWPATGVTEAVVTTGSAKGVELTFAGSDPGITIGAEASPVDP